jgi:hypothetical protein
MGETRNACNISIGKMKVRRPHGYMYIARNIILK